jgi:hypothetical protein
MPSPFPGYDLLGYDLAIDATRSPEPPLDDPASAAAESLLRTAAYTQYE